MAAPGDVPGQDEGFAELDTQEDEAMEVANSTWEQEGKLFNLKPCTVVVSILYCSVFQYINICFPHLNVE